MVDLEVTSNTNGKSAPDPEVAGKDLPKEQLSIDNVADGAIVMHFPADMDGQEVTVKVTDKDGNKLLKKTIAVKAGKMQVKCKLKPGSYTVKITGHHNIVAETTVTKS